MCLTSNHLDWLMELLYTCIQEWFSQGFSSQSLPVPTWLGIGLCTYIQERLDLLSIASMYIHMKQMETVEPRSFDILCQTRET